MKAIGALACRANLAVESSDGALVDARMAKLKVVIDRIQAIAPRISSEPLSRAHHAPEPSASPNECFANAERKARQDGGRVWYGWMFQARGLAALPGHGCLIAVNHAVWLAPDKKLIDVTPFHPDQKEHPIVVDARRALGHAR